MLLLITSNLKFNSMTFQLLFCYKIGEKICINNCAAWTLCFCNAWQIKIQYVIFHRHTWLNINVLRFYAVANMLLSGSGVAM